MSLIGIVLLLLVIIVFAAVVLFVIRNVGHLVINSIVGLLALFVVNYFHLMQYAGKPDIGIDWITVIICALAGLPGAILLMSSPSSGSRFDPADPPIPVQYSSWGFDVTTSSTSGVRSQSASRTFSRIPGSLWSCIRSSLAITP